MLNKTLLRKWFHRLPTPVISLIRRLRRLPPPGNDELTDEDWQKTCQDLLRNMGGTSSPAALGAYQISWPSKQASAPMLTASLRPNPSSDLSVFYQVWHEQQYRAVVEYMRPWTLPTDEMHIIDAGANVGFTTLYLKSYFPNAQIVSLEPEDSNFAQLTSNVAGNHFPEMTLLNAGLWKSQAYLEVGRDVGDQREWSFYVKEVPGPTSLQGYDVQSLRQQAKWEYIDLLKIDIEGAERYLFADDELAARTLQNARFLAIEIHDEFHIRPRIYDCLDKLGFDYFDSGELTIGRNKHLVK